MNERKSLPSTSAAEADPPSKQDVAPSRGLLPRLLRFRDAPSYLGMDRNRFNAEVRPYVTVIRIGRQGVAFDRLELDAWVDQYKSRNGRPGQLKGDMTWDEKGSRASTRGAGFGISTRSYLAGDFAKALARATSKKPSGS